jgi:tellurite resistance protein
MRLGPTDRDQGAMDDLLEVGEPKHVVPTPSESVATIAPQTGHVDTSRTTAIDVDLGSLRQAGAATSDRSPASSSTHLLIREGELLRREHVGYGPSPFLNVPVGLFASAIGLAALSLAWRLAHVRFGVPAWASAVVAGAAVLAFLCMCGAYAAKAWAAPNAIREEFASPVLGSLFATIPISLLLFPVVLAPVFPTVALVSWTIGTISMAAFAWLIVDRWMESRQQVAHATPAWIVPIVGVLDVPLAMPSIGLESLHGVMVAGLAIGMFFAVPLFTLIFSRLLFEERLPEALQPSLLILVGPFAVGTSAYIATTGQIDLFAQALYGVTLFLLAVLIGRLRYLGRCCPFRLTWWAVSFPLASAASAALRVAIEYPGVLNDCVAVVLLLLSTGVIAWLGGRTLLGIARGELGRLAS